MRETLAPPVKNSSLQKRLSMSLERVTPQMPSLTPPGSEVQPSWEMST